MDSQPKDRDKIAGTAAEEKVPDILDAISRASTRTISGLKATLEPQSLNRAVSLLGGAGKTCIIGFGDAYPAAVLLAGGLIERGRACSVFGPHVDSAEHEISLLGPDDLIVLIKLPGEDSPEDSLADAGTYEVPVLAIAEPAVCPESDNCHVRLPVPRTRVFGMPALAGHMAVAQLLLIALDRYRAATD